MQKKIITVVGATGTQGGSVVRTLLDDGSYELRGITRNVKGDVSQKLVALGVDMVQADVDDYVSLEKAFQGSYAIFAVTDFFAPFAKAGHEQAVTIESQQGINLANAAAATSSLEHYIWSTLPNTRRISEGAHVVPHFEGKNKVDDYIKANRTLYPKTTFVWFTFFAQNFRWPTFTPFPIPTAGFGTYVQVQGTPPTVPIKCIGDAEVNIGLFVKSILSQPDKTRGKFVLAEVEDLTAGKLLEVWANAQNKEAVYLHIEKETYYKLWPKDAEEVDRMQMFWEAAKEKSWTGEDEIVTTADLGVTGLVNMAEAFAKMKDWDKSMKSFEN